MTGGRWLRFAVNQPYHWAIKYRCYYKRACDGKIVRSLNPKAWKGFHTDAAHDLCPQCEKQIKREATNVS